MSEEDIIFYNATTDFEPLLDIVISRGLQYYGGPPLTSYHPKIIRSDHDGVWNAPATTELCMILQEELKKENNGIRENFEYLMEVFKNVDVSLQEYEISELYRTCNVTLPQVIRADYRARKRFEFVKNTISFVSALRKELGGYMEIYSGSFQRAVKTKNNAIFASYPLSLESVWESVGLSKGQVNGSYIVCDEGGKIIRVKIMLGPRKRFDEILEKSFYLPYKYYTVFTDNMASDAPMMECNSDLSPIGLSVTDSRSNNLPQGLVISCPDARNDAMKRLLLLKKIDRGIVQSLGMSKEKIKAASALANDIKRLFPPCIEDFFKHRDDYVEKSVNFLNLLTLKLGSEFFPLFPERLTKVREILEVLKHESDPESGRKLIKTLYELMSRYSPEFQRIFL